MHLLGVIRQTNVTFTRLLKVFPPAVLKWLSPEARGYRLADSSPPSAHIWLTLWGLGLAGWLKIICVAYTAWIPGWGGGLQRREGGKEKMGGINEKSRSPDSHNAAADDKGYGDSSSSLWLGLAETLCGTHCQVKGSCTHCWRKAGDPFGLSRIIHIVGGYAFNL